MRLASRSLWKTSWPLSGHLTHRFSGVSRRRNERIFGGTTLEIQFIELASIQGLRDAAHARRDTLDHSRDRLDAIRSRPPLDQRAAQRLDQRGADDDAVGIGGDRWGAAGVSHAEADRYRQMEIG